MFGCGFTPCHTLGTQSTVGQLFSVADTDKWVDAIDHKRGRQTRFGKWYNAKNIDFGNGIFGNGGLRWLPRLIALRLRRTMVIWWSMATPLGGGGAEKFRRNWSLSGRYCRFRLQQQLTMLTSCCRWWGPLSGCGGSSRPDGGRKDNRVLLLHCSGEAFSSCF